MSRIGQSREVLRRNLQMQICCCLQTGEFCSKFPALNPLRLWLCCNNGGVASPEPELPSQLIWCTSLQLKLCLVAVFLVAVFQSLMALQCCVISVDEGCQLRQLLHTWCESGAQSRQGGG